MLLYLFSEEGSAVRWTDCLYCY